MSYNRMVKKEEISLLERLKIRISYIIRGNPGISHKEGEHIIYYGFCGEHGYYQDVEHTNGSINCPHIEHKFRDKND